MADDIGSGDIEAGVRRALADRVALVDVDRIDAQMSLIDLGLDSTAILGLVIGIEETFSVEIADDDINPDNFASIATITRFLGSRIAL